MTPFQKAVQILTDFIEIKYATLVIEEIKADLHRRYKVNKDWWEYREDDEDGVYWCAVISELENAKAHIEKNRSWYPKVSETCVYPVDFADTSKFLPDFFIRLGNISEKH